ncbi:nuclear transport factor 2 family protein [Demequina sp. NBRC 110056]|uniref:nuclear transport factor 2 family protein n=1 Tax=Demequina sp. NBRC 110056 TaxID=1570345 RepID=UPI000A065BD4|nr:nuclear transport factor 2 family protein [Demequina sp. NBRC 110056]
MSEQQPSEQHIPEPIASFIAAVNGHDETAFLEAFVQGGYVDDWGRIFRGRDEIKAWSDKEFLGANGTLDVREVEVEGHVVTGVGDWRSSHANGLSSFEFVPEEGRIASMTIREG